MEMVKHYHKADQKRVDLPSDSLKLGQECDAVSVITEDRTSMVNISGDIVE